MGDFSFGTDGASSSDNDEDDNELAELGAEATSILGMQSRTEATDRQRRVVTTVDKKITKDMSWFEAGPFRYNGRLMLVAIPGVALVLSVGGDLLITAMTIGTLVTYLLHIAGQTQKSMMSYIVTFGCCQMVVIYSALPLLWHTVFNFFLIGLLNCFSVLTGAWGILFFDNFRAKEPDLTKLIESSLFAMYPAVNVILLTWIISGTISPAIAPYGLLVIGFMVLQLFMTPTPSSFYKGDPRDTERMHVLDSATIGAMAIIYAALPPAIYTYLSVLTTFSSVLTVNFAVELLFLGSLSTFLSTLMNVRQFIEVSGIEYKSLVRLRWVSGLLALLCLSGVLHKHGFSVSLLPWLSVGVALTTVYGFLAAHKQYRKRSIVVALLLLALYAFVFTKLPWGLEYRLKSCGLHINNVHMLLFVNVVLCIVCIYASVTASPELVGALVLIQAAVMVGVEKLLWASDLYMTSTMVLSAIFSLYLYLRLYHAGKLTWFHTLVAMAIHLIKTSDCCDALLPKGMLRSDWTVIVYNDLTTFILALVLVKVILFENQAVSFNKWLFYMFMFIMALMLAMPGLIFKLFYVALGHSPSFSDLNSFGLLAASLVSIKLTLQGNLKYDWLGASHVGPTAMATAILLFHLKPEGIFAWEELNKWLVLLNLMSCFMLIPAASLLRSPWLLSLLATLLGFPLGFAVASWVYPADTEIVYFFLYGLTSSLLCCTGLFTWRKVPEVENKLFTLFLVTVLCCLALLAEDLEHPEQEVFPGAIATMATILLTALILKLHSFRDKCPDLTVGGAVNVPKIALCGNLCTVIAFLLLCYMCPVDIHELWYIASSAVLLLLQPDPYLLRGLSATNNAAPLFYVTTVILWLAALSASAAFSATDTIPFLLGYIEVFILLTGVPIYFMFFTILWSGRFLLSDRLVVFITPISLFLFVFGSSYQATAVAMYNIAIGLWLANYKLPLQTDYT